MDVSMCPAVRVTRNDSVDNFFKSYENPVYFNIIREPVSLFISNFYYKRFGFESGLKNVADNEYMQSEWRSSLSENDR